MSGEISNRETILKVVMAEEIAVAIIRGKKMDDHDADDNVDKFR